MSRLKGRHPGLTHLNTISGPRPLSVTHVSPWRPWAFLLLITTAELLTTLVSPQLGLAVQGLLLIGLISCGVAIQAEQEANLLLALTLVPLIRLLSLSLPLATLPRLLWYPAVAIALMPALWLAVRTVRVTPRELGLQPGNSVLQILVACTGLGIGVLEYAILRPGPLVASTSWRVYVLAALILVVFTGFTEELLFRGLLLRLAWKSMVRGAALYVSLLYAAMHIGYGSLENVALMFAVGALFAWFVRRTGSILGVSLAHGIASVTLFLLVPLLLSQPFGIQVFRGLLVVSGVALVAAVAVFVAASLMTKVKGDDRRAGRVEV